MESSRTKTRKRRSRRRRRRRNRRRRGEQKLTAKDIHLEENQR